MRNSDLSIRSNRGGDRSFTAEKLRAEALYVADLIEVLRSRTAGLRRDVTVVARSGPISHPKGLRLL